MLLQSTGITFHVHEKGSYSDLVTPDSGASPGLSIPPRTCTPRGRVRFALPWASTKVQNQAASSCTLAMMSKNGQTKTRSWNKSSGPRLSQTGPARTGTMIRPSMTLFLDRVEINQIYTRSGKDLVKLWLRSCNKSSEPRLHQKTYSGDRVRIVLSRERPWSKHQGISPLKTQLDSYSTLWLKIICKEMRVILIMGGPWYDTRA